MAIENEYAAILDSVADTNCEDHATVLQFCAFSIEGGIDWPRRDCIDALGFLSRGFGCWLQEITAAIDAAPMPEDRRAVWHAAFNGASALIQHFYIDQRRPTPSLGMKPPTLRQ